MKWTLWVSLALATLGCSSDNENGNAAATGGNAGSAVGTSCADRVYIYQAHVDDIEEIAYTQCATSDECMVLRYDSACSGACNIAINAEAEEYISGLFADLDADDCAGFEDSCTQMPIASTGCAVGRTAECFDQRCRFAPLQ